MDFTALSMLAKVSPVTRSFIYSGSMRPRVPGRKHGRHDNTQAYCRCLTDTAVYTLKIGAEGGATSVPLGGEMGLGRSL